MESQDHLESSPVVQQIRQHEDDLRHHRIRPRLSQCPRCHHVVERGLWCRRHQLRSRVFLVQVADLIHRIESLLSRWRCMYCRQTFTWHPAFAVPHKRYVLTQMVSRCRDYVDNERVSYRQAASHEGRLLFHVQSNPAITAHSRCARRCRVGLTTLAHTTVYRWVTTLGSWRNALRHAWRLIQQKAPSTSLVGDLASLRIAPRKYRTDERRRVLLNCASWCLTEAVYGQIFGGRILHPLRNARGVVMN